MAPSEELTARAQGWARALVQQGLLNEERAKQAFYGYWEKLQQGGQDSFPAYLVAEGILSQSAVEGLARGATGRYQAVADPNAGAGSGRVEAPQGATAVAPPPAPPVAPRDQDLLGMMGEAVDAASGKDMTRTLTFDRVIPSPRDQAAQEGSGTGLSSTCKEVESDPGFALLEDSQEKQEEEFFAEVSEDDAQQTELPKVGDQVGDYALEEELGSGAMGIIFKAQHTGSGEAVAVKFLLGMDRPGAKKRRQRFQREVEALRRLTHENIVSVHTCGRHGKLDYYVMDYVVGRELRDLLLEKALAPKRKLEVFEAICSAVAHAHERGVVHRDLKPANVLIDADDRVLVLDFGLAKLIGDEDEKEKMELTRSNATIGTPYYMSPEQFTDAKGVDWRADVYALGVLLFEMMTGRRPFQGDTAGELIKKVLQDAPTPPSSLNPALTLKFDEIVGKALEKKRENRYQQVEELRLAVASYRRGAFLQVSLVDRYKDKASRWLTTHKVPFLIGFLLASLFWLPIVFLAYLVG